MKAKLSVRDIPDVTVQAAIGPVPPPEIDLSPGAVFRYQGTDYMVLRHNTSYHTEHHTMERVEKLEVWAVAHKKLLDERLV